jgi:hypothetical protein
VISKGGGQIRKLSLCVWFPSSKFPDLWRRPFQMSDAKIIHFLRNFGESSEISEGSK